MSIVCCGYCNKQIDTDFIAEHFLTREDSKWGKVVNGCIESRSDMKHTEKIPSIAQDFLPHPTGERSGGTMIVEPVSRGFAYAICFGFILWSILGLIFLFVKPIL